MIVIRNYKEVKDSGRIISKRCLRKVGELRSRKRVREFFILKLLVLI